MTRLGGWKKACLTLLFCVSAAMSAPAQTFNSIFSFDGNNGSGPQYGSLVQGIDGNFYGTTSGGGDESAGTVYKITPGGQLTTLYRFCSQANCADGDSPLDGLLLGTDGNFYGTTFYGGANNATCGGIGCGTVFKITATGKLTTLYSFCSQPNCADGAAPRAPLIQTVNGDLYGTTSSGGNSNSFSGCNGCGTAFRITPAGKLTTLYLFCSTTNCHDGWYPQNLGQNVDGTLYGTTFYGGLYGAGTVFKMTQAGKHTVMHSFSDKNDGGAYVGRGLVRTADGDFYGTTELGGTENSGTIFEMTPSVKFTTLVNINPDFGGGSVVAPLIQGTDGNFYGVTYGALFQMTPDGTLTRLHEFDGSDGSYAEAGMLQSTNGTFYGTTSAGGSSNLGTVFSLSMNLPPFVAFVMQAGRVGGTVGILGQGFVGTTGVSFNGTDAPFKVVSGTLLKATVPAGATTGSVTVTTPSGALTSNVPFCVIP